MQHDPAQHSLALHSIAQHSIAQQSVLCCCFQSCKHVCGKVLPTLKVRTVTGLVLAYFYWGPGDTLLRVYMRHMFCWNGEGLAGMIVLML